MFPYIYNVPILQSNVLHVFGCKSWIFISLTPPHGPLGPFFYDPFLGRETHFENQ